MALALFNAINNLKLFECRILLHASTADGTSLMSLQPTETIQPECWSYPTQGGCIPALSNIQLLYGFTLVFVEQPLTSPESAEKY